MEQRTFGKTGEKFSILSFGGQRIVDGHGCSETEAIRMLNYSLDHGIRYYDTAWLYSAGQSEERIGKVAHHRRKEMWIATKARARDKNGARKQLEESLKRLQTDHVDEWRMHDVWSLHELDEIVGEPLQEEGVTTVSGWVTHRLGGFPKAGDALTVGLCELRVEAMDGTRVAKLKITKRPVEETSPMI